MRIPYPTYLLPVFPSILFCLLFIQSIPTVVKAQPSPATNPPPTVNIQPFARGRIFSASTQSPIANTISRVPEIVETTGILITHFQVVDSTVNHALAVSRREQPRRNNTLPVCNNRSIPWRSAANNFAKHRGWPIDWSRQCVTDIYGTPKLSDLTDSDLESIIFRREHMIDNISDEIVAAVGVTNWTHPESNARFAFNRGSQKCELGNASGVRVRGSWYVTSVITNRPGNEWLQAGERQFLVEYVRVDDDKLVSALMILPVNPVEGTVHRVEAKSTTIIGKWAGAVQPSQFHPARAEENIALRDAVDKGEHYLQQVEDATTASNVAILALPLVLGLVPIGLVADVTRKRMLLYVVLSDVLTALPMWIKGVELLQIAKKRFTSSVTRVGDVSVEEDVTVVAEIWVASCGSQENVRAIGVAFIVVASLFMIIGVGLEIVVRIRQRGKWKEGEYEVIQEEFDGEDWVEAIEPVGVAKEKRRWWRRAKGEGKTTSSNDDIDEEL